MESLHRGLNQRASAFGVSQSDCCWCSVNQGQVSFIAWHSDKQFLVGGNLTGLWRASFRQVRSEWEWKSGLCRVVGLSGNDIATFIRHCHYHHQCRSPVLHLHRNIIIIIATIRIVFVTWLFSSPLPSSSLHWTQIFTAVQFADQPLNFSAAERNFLYMKFCVARIWTGLSPLEPLLPIWFRECVLECKVLV